MESSLALSVFDRLTAVRNAVLDGKVKLLLFVLVSYANNNGDAWPSNERLSADLQLSVRHVQRLVRELEQAKIVTARMEGRKRVLRIDWQRLTSMATSSPTSTAKGDTSVMDAKRPMTSTSPQGCHGCHQNIPMNLPVLLKRERKTRTGDTDVTRHTAAKKQQRLVPDQLDQLIAAWNQLPDGIVPRCHKRSEAIARLWTIATRHADVAAVLNDVPKLVAAIRESSFLHGQNWFRFSWLFGKSRSGEWNVCKIIEGNYRDRSNAKPKSAARWQGDASDFDHLTVAISSAAAAGDDRKLESRSA